MDKPSDRIEIVLDEVRFGLRAPCDFAWLREYGRVFAVFDQQDSGNLCFGVESEAGRRFVKFAGARTLEYPGEPAAAVARLAAAMPAYEALRHPTLVPLLAHGPVAGGRHCCSGRHQDLAQTTAPLDGYAAVFEWFPGECLHSHWRFAGANKFGHPDSPNYRFVRLSLEKRLAAYGAILAFHRHVEACGYLAIDFYDGSILYDFAGDRTRVCDIDFYTPGPYVNAMGACGAPAVSCRRRNSGAAPPSMPAPTSIPWALRLCPARQRRRAMAATAAAKAGPPARRSMAWPPGRWREACGAL